MTTRLRDALPKDRRETGGKIARAFFLEKPPQTAWYTVDIEEVQALLDKIGKIIGLHDSNRDLYPFLESGLLRNVLIDRDKQIQIASAIIKALAKEKSINQKRKFNTVAQICEASDELRKLPNRISPECLVVVDGVINRVDTQSNADLYSCVQVTPRVEGRYNRLVRFMLSDQPWPLLSLESPCIGLMVNQRALAKTYPVGPSVEGAVDIVSLDGWYPFAKVIGYWQTDRGGRPYIDVLAILAKTYPTMGELLRPREGSKRKLLQMLENGRENTKKPGDYPQV